MKLLTEHNPKTAKGEKQGYLTAILHLAPSDHSGFNVCPLASPACRKDCLFFAGRGRMRPVSEARIRKTKYFFSDRENFLLDLNTELTAFEKRASRKGMIPTVRLNGLSDLPWEGIAPNLFTSHSEIMFYDYTKIPKRMGQFLYGDLPDNYHLTFSRSETNERDAAEILDMGGNVAALFRDGVYPAELNGFPVIDGDENDLRFLDPSPVIIGLRPKGPMSQDETGFVLDL